MPPEKNAYKGYNIAAVVVRDGIGHEVSKRAVEGRAIACGSETKPLPRPPDLVMERNASNRRKLTLHSYTQARAFIEAGDMEAAVERLALCCAAAPQEPRYFQKRGVCYTRLGKHQEALEDFVECTRLDPKEANFHAHHGDALRALGELHKANEAYSRAVTLDSSNGEHFRCRGEVYQLLKQHDKAVEDFDIAVRLLEPIRPTFGVVTDRGKSHREMGNLELAIKDFGTALARRPNDIQLMLLQGQAYMKAEDWLHAIDLLNKALKIDPAHANLHDQLGEGCFGCALGYQKERKQKAIALDMDKPGSIETLRELEKLEEEHFEQAEACYERAIQFDAKEPEFLFHRGKFFFYKGKYDLALDDFQRAAAMGGPNLVEYLFHVGHTYNVLGERHHSINAYRKAVLTDSTHQGSLIKLGRALHVTGDYDKNTKQGNTGSVHYDAMVLIVQLRSREEFKAGITMQAARLMTSALITNPDNLDVMSYRGCIYRDMMEFTLALKDLDTLLTRDPERTNDYFHRGQVLLGLGRYYEAHDAFDEALHRGYSSKEIHNWNGLVYRAEEKWEDATAAIAKAIVEDPYEAKYYFNRGMCHQLAKNLEGAIADFSRALVHDPGCVEYLHTRGLVLCKVQRYRAALADLKAAQTGLSPELDEELLAESWYYVGIAHTGLKNPAQAVEAFTKALIVRPKYAHVLHERAKAFQDAGNEAEAMDDFNAVLALQPNNAHALFRRGFLWKKCKQYEQAAQDFEAARKLTPENPAMWLDYNRIGEMDYIVLCLPGEETEHKEGQTAIRKVAVDKNALMDM